MTQQTPDSTQPRVRMFSCTAEQCSGQREPGTGRHHHIVIGDGPQSLGIASKVTATHLVAPLKNNSALHQQTIDLIAATNSLPETCDDDSVYAKLIDEEYEARATMSVPAIKVVMFDGTESIREFIEMLFGFPLTTRTNEPKHELVKHHIKCAHDGTTFHISSVSCNSCQQSTLVFDDPAYGPLSNNLDHLLTLTDAEAFLDEAAVKATLPSDVVNALRVQLPKLLPQETANIAEKESSPSTP